MLAVHVSASRGNRTRERQCTACNACLLFVGAEQCCTGMHACTLSMAGCGPRLDVCNTSLHACVHLANVCSSIYLQSGIKALERMLLGLYDIV